MNCKPFDLAVVVVDKRWCGCILGRIFRLSTLADTHTKWGPRWNFTEGSVHCSHYPPPTGGSVILDSCLKPIQGVKEPEEVRVAIEEPA